MFCLFSIAMATQGHLFGFQMVCSAELCMCLEGETLLGAQPAGTGATTASCLDPTVLPDMALTLEPRKGCCRGWFCFFFNHYFKRLGFVLLMRRATKLAQLLALSAESLACFPLWLQPGVIWGLPVLCAGCLPPPGLGGLLPSSHSPSRLRACLEWATKAGRV